ncbi:MAG: hypothetical protein J2P48_09660 [Alphaproteobacteria bacterium]|nr:hypothetical protein [Alphaproteobacteria bacterium]
MGARLQPPDPFGYGRRPATFSAWAIAIVFATLAIISFAVDQTVDFAPSDDQAAPSLLHPVKLIQSLIGTAGP